MEKIIFKDMQKRDLQIGVKVSHYEKERLDNFCSRHNVTISDLVRYSLRKIMQSEK